MKKLIIKNKIWALFFVLSFASSLFLFNEYQSAPKSASSGNEKNTLIEKEAALEEEEFESRDFYIIKNISELISDIFSISI